MMRAGGATVDARRHPSGLEGTAAVEATSHKQCWFNSSPAHSCSLIHTRPMRGDEMLACLRFKSAISGDGYLAGLATCPRIGEGERQASDAPSKRCSLCLNNTRLAAHHPAHTGRAHRGRAGPCAGGEERVMAKQIPDRAEFKTWLEANRNRIVGSSCRMDCCPIATFLRQVKGWPRAQVRADRYALTGEFITLPRWAKRFTGRLNVVIAKGDERRVRGLTALRILDAIEE